MSVFGGELKSPNTTSTCAYCPVSDTSVFLAGVSSNYEDRWRNFGLLWVFVFFNIAAALFVYWLARMPKNKLGGKKKKAKKE